MGSARETGRRNYGCECRVAQIIARETQALNAAAVGRRPWPATSLFERRWITDADKAELARLADLTDEVAEEEALRELVDGALPLQVEAPVEADAEKAE
jgi:hypothetical protein